MKFAYTADGMVNLETKGFLNFGAGAWLDKKWTTIVQRMKDSFKDLSEDYYGLIGDTFSAMTKMVTTIPVELLNNPGVHKMQGLFMGYSVLMMIFLSIIEGYKALIGVNYTRISTMFGRTFVALVGAGLTVPAVVWLVKCSNLAVEMILLLGETYFNGSSDIGTVLKDFSKSGGVNFAASLLFLVAFFYFIVQAMFKVGIRWFDLLMNVVTSPFAWASYLTNGTASHLASWMASTGKLILINMVYAFYVIVISVLIMAPGPVESFGGWTGRMLLLVGGLYRLANPPAWIAGMDTSGSMAPFVKKMAFKLPRPKAVKS